MQEEKPCLRVRPNWPADCGQSRAMRSLLVTLLALVLPCGSIAAVTLVPVPTLQPMLPAAGLELNKGQAPPGVLFLSRGTNSLAVMSQAILYSSSGITLALVASNPNPMVGLSDPLPGLANTYTGADPTKWITGIPRYATATLAAVYPGVNAQYIIDSFGALTLNLTLAAGVDPSVIQFQVAQAINTVINADGALQATTAQGYEVSFGLLFPAPLAVQGPANLVATYSVQSAKQFGLAVQGVDLAQPLQISLRLNAEYGQSISYGRNPHFFDAAGNGYFGNEIMDAAGGSGCGVQILVPVSCQDVAIYKYSAAGLLSFVTYLAGNLNEAAGFIGVAPDGAVVVAGETASPDFPVTPGALQPANGSVNQGVSGGNFFAARLDATTGQLLTSTFLGGPSPGFLGSAALGADGSLYLLPTFSLSSPPGMPVTGGALLSACQSNPCQNGFAARLSPQLDKLIFGTYMPGISQATAQLGPDGSIYYAGTATSGFPTTPGAYQTQNAGGYDGIVARLDPTGTKLLFATYIGTANTDWVLLIAVAPDGTVWADVSSFVECCVSITTELLHLDSKGAKLLAQASLSADQMVVDQAGNLFALASSGFASQPELFAVGACYSGAAEDAYVELSPTGQQLLATYLPAGVMNFDGSNAQGTPYLDAPSGRVKVVQAQLTGPYALCLVDSAGFNNSGTTSPGAIIAIFGNGLGPTQGVESEWQNGQVPSSLGGTQILVNGEAVPILYSSSGQLNAILPYTLAVGSTINLQVVNNGAPSNSLSAFVMDQGISLYRVGAAVAALNQDGSINSANNPALPGSAVVLFGTGGGLTNPASVAGEVTPLALFPLVILPQAQVGGYPATVFWAGAAPGLVAGATQINMMLPDSIRGYPTGVQAIPVSLANSNGFVFDQTPSTIWVAFN